MVAITVKAVNVIVRLVMCMWVILTLKLPILAVIVSSTARQTFSVILLALATASFQIVFTLFHVYQTNN